jgi:hypothetical protein
LGTRRRERVCSGVGRVDFLCMDWSCCLMDDGEELLDVDEEDAVDIVELVGIDAAIAMEID